MTRVWERLFIGCRKDAETLYRDNPHRISTVISLSEEPVRWRSRRIAYLHFPTAPDALVSRAQFDAVIDAISENIRWGTVLVQCAAGVSVSPVIVAAWMHVVGYKKFDDALAEVKKLRPNIAPSAILLNSIKNHL
jgi:protein-tyrosine phosphatase